MTRDFKIVNADTDSISFCKPDGAPFSEQEQIQLLEELNTHFPKLIRWEHDGVYERMVVVKAKNYAMRAHQRLTTKGSALKATTKEPALRKFILDVLEALLDGKDLSVVRALYENLVREAFTLKDITPWCSKKSVTEAVMRGKRTNERRVRDALEGTDFSEGDKRFFFFKSDGSLCLREHFQGEYDALRLVGKIYQTLEIFSTVLDLSNFPKYHLKGKRRELDKLLAQLELVEVSTTP